MISVLIGLLFVGLDDFGRMVEDNVLYEKVSVLGGLVYDVLMWCGKCGV